MGLKAMGKTKAVMTSLKDRLQPLWKSPVGLGIIVLYFILATYLAIPSMKALQPVDQYYNNIYGTTAGLDYRIFYSAGKLANNSDFTTLYDEPKFDPIWRKEFNISIPGRTHFSYPPIALMVWAPLSKLSYSSGLSLWVGIPCLMVLLLLYHMSKSFLVLAITLTSPLFLFSAISGQTGYIITCLLVGGLLCLDKKKYILAGIIFGFLCFKPHLALALPICLILTRQWKVILSGTLTGLLLVTLSYWTLGPESWTAFFEHFGKSLDTEIPVDGKSSSSSFTLWNIFLKVTQSNIAAITIHATGMVFAVLVTVYTWKNTTALMPRLLTLIIFPAFVSPYYHAYDFAPLVIVYGLAVKDLLFEKQPDRALLIAVFIWVLGFGAFKTSLHTHFLIPTFFILLPMALAALLTKADLDRKSVNSGVG